MTDRDPSFENFYKTCDNCRFMNVFNRKDDLKRLEPIARREVKCQKCQSDLVLMNDIANPPYDYLLMQAEDAFHEKRYMEAVTTGLTGVEVFLTHCLYVELCLKPWATRAIPRNLPLVNALAEAFYPTLQKKPFAKLRGTVIHCFLERPFTSEAAVRAFIARMPALGDPSDRAIAAVVGTPIHDILVELKATKINDLRNYVAHRAYRPGRDEVDVYLNEIRHLEAHIKGHGDIKPAELYFNRR